MTSEEKDIQVEDSVGNLQEDNLKKTVQEKDSQEENFQEDLRNENSQKENSQEVLKEQDSQAQIKKVANNDSTRKKKMFYEIKNGVKCIFDNGEPLRIDKWMLAYHIPRFWQIFFDESPKTNDINIDGESDTFRIFLDYLFNLKELNASTISDALLIFPVAHKYKAEELLKKCADVLLPEKIKKHIYLTFHLGEKKVFLADIYNPRQLGNDILAHGNYLNFLGPAAIYQIIDLAEMNSYFWGIIYRWGQNYLKSHNKPDDVYSLFKENRILPKLSLSHFESAESILDFHNLSDKKLLDPNEILIFLACYSIKDKILPDRSLWLNVKKGEKIIEVIKLKHSFRILKDEKENWINLRISSNTMYSDKTDILEYKIRYIYKNNSSVGAETPKSKWPWDPKPLFGSASLLLSRPLSAWETFWTSNRRDFGSKFSVDKKLDQFSIRGVKITYKFDDDCTILKTSSDKNFTSERLCFTSNVTCEKMMY